MFEFTILIFMFVVGGIVGDKDLMIVCAVMYLLSNQRNLENELEDLQETINEEKS